MGLESTITEVVKKSTVARDILFVLGGTVLVLTAIHYYVQIKVTRLKIAEMKDAKK